MPPIVYFMHLSSMWITRWMSGLLISLHQTDYVFTQKGYFSACVVFLVFARGEFITLCLQRKNNLAFSSGRRGEKEKEIRPVLWFYGHLSSTVLNSCTDQSEICSLLQVVAGSQRHFQGWSPGGAGKGGGSGPRGWFFFSSPFWCGCWESRVAGGEAGCKTRYWLN